MAKNIVGVSEETTTGVKRLYEMQVRGVICGCHACRCGVRGLGAGGRALIVA